MLPDFYCFSLLSAGCALSSLVVPLFVLYVDLFLFALYFITPFFIIFAYFVYLIFRLNIFLFFYLKCTYKGYVSIWPSDLTRSEPFAFLHFYSLILTLKIYSPYPLLLSTFRIFQIKQFALVRVNYLFTFVVVRNISKNTFLLN